MGSVDAGNLDSGGIHDRDDGHVDADDCARDYGHADADDCARDYGGDDDGDHLLQELALLYGQF